MGGSESPKPITGVVQSSWHLTSSGAYRARRKWMKSVRGRDAYVHRRARLHWEVRLLDYAPLEAALAQMDRPQPLARVVCHDPSCAQMNTQKDTDCTCASGQKPRGEPS
jgi:hypothetical protein